ncbi:DUF1836 domain-containing protein [Gemmiger formicilis]|uniref:DUF1836 domain-containing protein n=1 Tax=Gemmiger formicilis TaxID=745368 RepID=UPI00195A762F|nr:DUF1836 domain-containing protein [Gemmiger formicilis]MBM6914107.1 DUF1836 domain-containing protein [Gemmiger formicilis]
MEQTFRQSQLAEQLLQFHCPRWAELPGIQLYMDQLTGYINEALAPLGVGSENNLTKAMVNNYVKQQVIARPQNKKYDRQQLASLLVLCVMKQVFSIPEVDAILRAGLAEYPPQVAYDYFCAELENALHAVLESDDITQPPDTASVPTELSAMVRRIVLACAGKVYVQKRLQFAARQEQETQTV